MLTFRQFLSDAKDDWTDATGAQPGLLKRINGKVYRAGPWPINVKGTTDDYETKLRWQVALAEDARKLKEGHEPDNASGDGWPRHYEVKYGSKILKYSTFMDAVKSSGSSCIASVGVEFRAGSDVLFRKPTIVRARREVRGTSRTSRSGTALGGFSRWRSPPRLVLQRPPRSGVGFFAFFHAENMGSTNILTNQRAWSLREVCRRKNQRLPHPPPKKKLRSRNPGLICAQHFPCASALITTLLHERVRRHTRCH